MTYPPQQPGPYGQQPGPYGQQPQPGPYGGQPGPYGGQPDPFSTQPAYQGFGGFPGGEPPKKSNTGKAVAIALIAILVLGGIGAAVFFLTKDDKEPTAAGGSSSSAAPTSESKGSSPTTSKSTKTTSATASDEPAEGGADDPKEVVDAYIQAYESKDFASVTSSACAAYKKKYGTDTTELEKQLKDLTISGTAKADPEVKGSTATAEIALKLTKADGTSQEPNIRIKIVKEGGGWRFCGEEAA